MDLNQIKKDLYKQKPLAYRIGDGITDEVGAYALYKTVCLDNIIYFQVPYSDMGNAQFDNVIVAQLLIRWISPEITTINN